eukprot:1134888-Pelagomonas_calceolata.AAC.1
MQSTSKLCGTFNVQSWWCAFLDKCDKTQPALIFLSFNQHLRILKLGENSALQNWRPSNEANCEHLWLAYLPSS